MNNTEIKTVDTNNSNANYTLYTTHRGTHSTGFKTLAFENYSCAQAEVYKAFGNNVRVSEYSDRVEWHDAEGNKIATIRPTHPARPR